MPDLIGKKHPDRDDVLQWFHMNSDRVEETIEFSFAINNGKIFKEKYSADDFIDKYDQWNLINQTLG